MSSAVLDFFREKSPGLKDVPDDDLTEFIADTHPAFLKEKSFSDRVQLVSEKKGVAATPEPSVTKEFLGEMAQPPEALKPVSTFLEQEKPPIEQDSLIQEAVAGLERAGIGLAQGALSRAGIATMAAGAIPGVGPAIAGTAAVGFGAKGLTDSLTQLRDAWKKGSVGGVTEAIGNMLTGAGLIGAGIKGVKSTVAPITETVSKTPTKPTTPEIQSLSTTEPLTAEALKKGPEDAQRIGQTTPPNGGGVLQPQPSEGRPTAEGGVRVHESRQEIRQVPKEEAVTEPVEPTTQQLDLFGPEGASVATRKVAEPSATGPHAMGIAQPVPPLIQGIAHTWTAPFEQLSQSIKGWLGTISGKTMPKTTVLDRPAGELGAKWISSRIAAGPLAEVFSTDVLEGTGVDPVSLGVALTEDNLRSVKQGFEQAGDAEKAAAVKTVIGMKDSPFQTEEQYQAFLNDPATQEAVRRHIEKWNETVEPMYKKAMLIDPEEELPTRGLQTGARINLYALKEGEPVGHRVTTIPSGTLLGTLQRKSPFGVQAQGTAESYAGNYHDLMANTFGRQLEIANKNEFEKYLVEKGLAVIGGPKEQPAFPAERFDLKRQTLIVPGEEGAVKVPQNKYIYVDKRIAGEYKRAANIMPGWQKSLADSPITQFVSKWMNRAALAGLTDPTVHVSNIMTALFTRPAGTQSIFSDMLISATGRADIPFTIGKTISKAFQDNRQQIAELAEIGAMRDQHPAGWAGRMIQTMDRTARLVLDDVYKSLVDQGLVEDTATNRREFVNQIGQYNKRAQGPWMNFFRESGVGPFITAGRNFNVLGARVITADAGVAGKGALNSAILRADVISKWIGGFMALGAMNYLLTKDKGGGLMGRPGVPLGNLDTGYTQGDLPSGLKEVFGYGDPKRPLSVPLFDIIGLGRGLRVTGVKGFVQSKLRGLDTPGAIDSAARDIINAQLSPISGPIVRAGVEAVSGYPPAVGVGRAAPIVPAGESQAASDVLHALGNVNPIIGSAIAAREPGGSIGKAIARQIPRFTLTPSNPPEMMSHYEEIVRKAKNNRYIDDVIGRARKMSLEERRPYIHEALSKLPVKDREHAKQELQHRRIKY